MSEAGRIGAITLDAASIARAAPEIEHERRTAIADLLERNNFAPACAAPGPYALTLGIVDERLLFRIADSTGVECAVHGLSLTPFRRLVRDYFMMCESYHDAVKTSPAGRIEAVDMARRALHDDGARIIVERMTGKAEMDFETARRLFTLVCALHWKG